MSALISNVIVTIILIMIISSALYYIYREKKKGVHCIGCPMAGSCPKHGHCNDPKNGSAL